MKEIKFTIRLGVEDLYHFMMSNYYSKFSGVFGLILSAVSAILLLTQLQTLSDISKLVLLVLALLFTAINPLMLRNKAKAQIKANKSLGSDLTYTLKDDHMMISLGEEKADIQWNQLVRVKETKRALFVYMTNARGYIWPKSQIENQYNDIIEILKTQVDGSKLKLKKR